MPRRALVYTIVIGVFVAAIAGLLRVGDVWYGAGATRPAAGTLTAAGAEPAAWYGNLRHPLAILIVQLLVIVLVAQLAGTVARRFRQPAVIGEIAAGLLLGPSLLGRVAPDTFAFLFPQDSLGVLRLMSQVGVILFMFTVGLDLDPSHLRQRAPTAIAVSHFSIVTPFLLGVLSALVLFPGYAPASIPFHAFALFMGIALSITAFPVLARVLEERGLTGTPLGSTAIACAAVDDVTAWTLLAMVVTLVTAGGIGVGLIVMLAVLAVFIAVMAWGVRPVVARFFDYGHRPLDRQGTAIGTRHHARLGTVHRSPRPPCAVRRISRGRDHAAKGRARPAASGTDGKSELGVSTPRVFRLHGFTH